MKEEEEATEGGGLDEGGGELGEGGGIEVEVQEGGEEEVTVGGVEIEEGEEVAMEDDEHMIDKASIMEHTTSKYNDEEELVEHRVEEGDGGNTGEGEASQLEKVLGRGEDANAALTGEWG